VIGEGRCLRTVRIELQPFNAGCADNAHGPVTRRCATVLAIPTRFAVLYRRTSCFIIVEPQRPQAGRPLADEGGCARRLPNERRGTPRIAEAGCCAAVVGFSLRRGVIVA